MLPAGDAVVPDDGGAVDTAGCTEAHAAARIERTLRPIVRRRAIDGIIEESLLVVVPNVVPGGGRKLVRPGDAG